jgi:hypothetical protein
MKLMIITTIARFARTTASIIKNNINNNNSFTAFTRTTASSLIIKPINKALYRTIRLHYAIHRTKASIVLLLEPNKA